MLTLLLFYSVIHCDIHRILSEREVKDQLFRKEHILLIAIFVS